MNSDDKEKHRRMVADAVKQVTQNDKLFMKPVRKLTTEQECLERANVRILRARSEFIAKIKLRATPPTFEELVEFIYPLLRSEFADWSKDDFATLACITLAINAAQSLHEHHI